jgi:hypothetical protein
MQAWQWLTSSIFEISWKYTSGIERLMMDAYSAGILRRWGIKIAQVEHSKSYPVKVNSGTLMGLKWLE